MESAVDSAVQSYYERSLDRFEKEVPGEIREHLLHGFIEIAKEVDDCNKPDTHCSQFTSYFHSSRRQQMFVDKVLRRLNKPFDGLQVISVLEGWGVFSRHENISVWKEELHRAKKFQTEVLKAARKVLDDKSGISISAKGRKDLTNVTSFAIDRSGTKEVDDAISYIPQTKTVLVHIADPAEYVDNDANHLLIKEASKRLVSVYARPEKIPMFPEDVARKLFSLRSGKKELHYATTFEFKILQNGTMDPHTMHVYASVVLEPICLSYREASRIMDTPRHHYFVVLDKLYSLAASRRKWRVSVRGARQSKQGSYDPKESKAHLLVDEIMISANTVAAQLAQRYRMPVLYRGVAVKRTWGRLSASTFRGTRYTCSIYGTGTQDRDIEKGVNVKLDICPIPHASLGVDGYVQVTSPIRKFADLIAHFQFNAVLSKFPLPFGSRELMRLKNYILEMERTAARIDRRTKKYWSYQQLEKGLGKVRYLGTLKKKAAEARETSNHPQRQTGREREAKSREAEWVVYLSQVRCDVTAVVPFRGKSGMEVNIIIEKVNPRTSYISAYAERR